MRIKILILSLLLVSLAHGQMVLWYRQPATQWMTQAIPIGNGRLGGMVFGGIAHE